MYKSHGARWNTTALPPLEWKGETDMPLDGAEFLKGTAEALLWLHWVWFKKGVLVDATSAAWRSAAPVSWGQRKDCAFAGMLSVWFRGNASSCDWTATLPRVPATELLLSSVSFSLADITSVFSSVLQKEDKFEGILSLCGTKYLVSGATNTECSAPEDVGF